MQSTLARTDEPGRVAALSQHSSDGKDSRRRVPISIATVSLGQKDAQGIPSVNRDNRITLHDPNQQANALSAALQASDGKELLVMFDSDDERDFIFQSFVKHSRTRLEAFGDEREITCIAEDGRRVTFKAGSEGYEKIKKDCKVQTFIFFYLARWNDDGSISMDLSDGMAPYRLRTTSRTAMDSLQSCLERLRAATGGRIAGIPVTVWSQTIGKADPNGVKRDVPTWMFAMRPPKGQKMLVTPSVLVKAITSGRGEVEQFRALALTMGGDVPGTQDMLEAIEAESVEVDAVALADVQRPHLPQDLCLRTFHASVKGSYLEDPAARAEWVRRTGETLGVQTYDEPKGRHSLAKLFEGCDAEQAGSVLCAAAEDAARFIATDQPAPENTGSTGRDAIDLFLSTLPLNKRCDLADRGLFKSAEGEESPFFKAWADGAQDYGALIAWADKNGYRLPE